MGKMLAAAITLCANGIRRILPERGDNAVINLLSTSRIQLPATTSI
jgi:hypothetical protein